MGSYQGAIAGASLRRREEWERVDGGLEGWGEGREKKKSVFRNKSKRRLLHVGRDAWRGENSTWQHRRHPIALCTTTVFTHPPHPPHTHATNSSPWANVCSAQTVNRKSSGQRWNTDADGQRSGLGIRTGRKYWQHMEEGLGQSGKNRDVGASVPLKGVQVYLFLASCLVATL